VYIPKLFREEDRERIVAFLKENNFPALVTHGPAGLAATHLVVEVMETAEGGLLVYGHMARANSQWKTFGEEEALLIFQGAHSYISPTWYNHLNVPTWNYTMVHVYGKVRILKEEELKSALGRLIERHEPTSAYRMETLPAEFVAKEMKGAVGFAVEVTRIEAGYKLSQNRDDQDHATIIRELEKRGDPASLRVASDMRRNRAPD
jgi:transcriptional regulator